MLVTRDLQQARGGQQGKLSRLDEMILDNSKYFKNWWSWRKSYSVWLDAFYRVTRNLEQVFNAFQTYLKEFKFFKLILKSLERVLRSLNESREVLKRFNKVLKRPNRTWKSLKKLKASLKELWSDWNKSWAILANLVGSASKNRKLWHVLTRYGKSVENIDLDRVLKSLDES